MTKSTDAVRMSDEREAFEAWRKSLMARPELTRVGDYYENHDTQVAWSGWQARAASTHPVATSSAEVGQWVHCSPALISAGVSCAHTPRRACECKPENGGHDHFISHAAPLAASSEPVENGSTKGNQS